MGETGAQDPDTDEAAAPAEGGAPSLVEEVSGLIEDGRTYAAAELAYQKARLAFVGSNAKQIAIFGGIAVLLVVLAIIVLVFGLLLALTPVIGPWAATAAVFGGLLLVAFLCTRLAAARWRDLSEAFSSATEESETE